MNFFKNKTILITGGTGTFGQRCTKTLLKYKPKKIIVFSRDEFKQFEMSEKFNNKSLRFFLGEEITNPCLKIGSSFFSFFIVYFIEASALVL